MVKQDRKCLGVGIRRVDKIPDRRDIHTGSFQVLNDRLLSLPQLPHSLFTFGLNRLNLSPIFRIGTQHLVLERHQLSRGHACRVSFPRPGHGMYLMFSGLKGSRSALSRGPESRVEGRTYRSNRRLLAVA